MATITSASEDVDDLFISFCSLCCLFPQIPLPFFPFIFFQLFRDPWLSIQILETNIQKLHEALSPQMRFVHRRTCQQLWFLTFLTSRSFPKSLSWSLKKGLPHSALDGRHWAARMQELRMGRGWGEVSPFSIRPSLLSHLHSLPPWLSPLVSICAENTLVHLFQRLNLQSSAGRGRRLGRGLTATVLVTSGCHNKISQTGGLKHQTFISWSSGGSCPLGVGERDLFLFL